MSHCFRFLRARLQVWQSLVSVLVSALPTISDQAGYNYSGGVALRWPNTSCPDGTFYEGATYWPNCCVNGQEPLPWKNTYCCPTGTLHSLYFPPPNPNLLQVPTASPKYYHTRSVRIPPGPGVMTLVSSLARTWASAASTAGPAILSSIITAKALQHAALRDMSSERTKVQSLPHPLDTRGLALRTD